MADAVGRVVSEPSLSSTFESSLISSLRELAAEAPAEAQPCVDYFLHSLVSPAAGERPWDKALELTTGDGYYHVVSKRRALGGGYQLYFRGVAPCSALQWVS